MPPIQYNTIEARIRAILPQHQEDLHQRNERLGNEREAVRAAQLRDAAWPIAKGIVTKSWFDKANISALHGGGSSPILAKNTGITIWIYCTAPAEDEQQKSIRDEQHQLCNRISMCGEMLRKVSSLRSCASYLRSIHGSTAAVLDLSDIQFRAAVHDWILQETRPQSCPL